MRGLLVGVCVVLVVAACGKVPGGPNPSAGDYKLYEATTTVLAVIDSKSQSVERTLPMGAASTDGKHIYSVTTNNLGGCTNPVVDGACLVDTDPLTGAKLHTLRLPGNFALPAATESGIPGGLSQDGRWLVLERLDRVPVATHLLAVDTSFTKPARQFDLSGNFQFDAISNDGLSMYLIEYLTGPDYRVRVYNVPAGLLDPNVVVDKSDGTASMQGVRLSGVASPDGQWLFSVYARENKGAFIHALNLSQSIAFCIDLPGSGYSSDYAELQWSLALTRDGSHLYAANGPMGIIADVNMTSGFPNLARTAYIDTPAPAAGIFAQDVQAKEFNANGVAVSPDGKTLVMAANSGLVWIDTATLHSHGRQVTDWIVRSVVASPDGQLVYALNDGGMIAELRMAGGQLSTAFSATVPMAFSAGGAQPTALIRVGLVSAR